MHIKHYELYLADRFSLDKSQLSGDDITEGLLIAKSGSSSVPIHDGIPRFFNGQGYAGNFGLQWNHFRSTQLDSATNLPLTFNRFWNNTRWQPKDIYGKTVLECGSGAGRFTEILLGAGAKVVSFDLTNAIDANYINNADKGDLFVFQGDIYDIPFPDQYFDYVFCYGVLQHTPDPVKAYRSIFSKLKPQGRISIDYYRKMPLPSVWSTPKYLWRPITSKMEPERLLRIIKAYIPFWLPIDTLVRKIPVFNRILSYIPIPCWNYINIGLTKEQRKEWAIMDTFDALGATYDFPKTLPEVTDMIASEDNDQIEVFYGSNGVVANVSRRS